MPPPSPTHERPRLICAPTRPPCVWPPALYSDHSTILFRASATLSCSSCVPWPCTCEPSRNASLTNGRRSSCRGRWPRWGGRPQVSDSRVCRGQPAAALPPCIVRVSRANFRWAGAACCMPSRAGGPSAIRRALSAARTGHCLAANVGLLRKAARPSHTATAAAAGATRSSGRRGACCMLSGSGSLHPPMLATTALQEGIACHFSHGVPPRPAGPAGAGARAHQRRRQEARQEGQGRQAQEGQGAAGHRVRRWHGRRHGRGPGAGQQGRRQVGRALRRAE